MLSRVTTLGDVRHLAERIGRALGPGRWGRLPLVLVIGASLVSVTAAVSGAASAPAGVRLAEAGRWFASPAQNLIYHVNGSAQTIDAELPINGMEPGTEVVQGETTGYVVGRDEIIEFGRATLAVEQTLTAPAGERPVAVEAKGGPYLVYRETGTVVRLGAEPRTIPAGRPLGEPVVTPDGSLWLHRTASNELCRLRPEATVLSCPAAAPRGHTGALTVVGDRAVFVDTDTDMLSPVTAEGLGQPVHAGVDLPADAGVAAADVRGRVAVLAPRQRQLHLIDARGLAPAVRPGVRPISVQLPAGSYATPSAGRSSVVLLDQQHRSVLTYEPDGRRQSVSKLPLESGEPRLSRGQDDRVYVEGGEGRQVLAVDDNGRARAVAPVGAGAKPSGQPPPTAPTQPGSSPQPPTGRPETTAVPPTATDQPPLTPGTTAAGTPRGTGQPVPASPPGLPPRARARVSGGDIVLSWDAAPANGAVVTGYLVTWAPAAGGDSQSVTRPGEARSAALTGLTQGVSYRITVAADNSAGRGPAATVRATVPKPPARRTITVSRGETTTHKPDCLPPECAYIQVELRGFAPNTGYQITPWSSEHGNFNPGARLTTDAEGNLTARHRFPYNGIDDTVWVVVDGQRSNRLVWSLE